jgi:hypothetical protein
VFFALESLNLINAITELQIATSSNLYKQLEGLKLKKETMMTHIIKNKKNIKKTDADKKAYLDAGKGRKNTFSSSSPVAQRNINRPKTDLY